MDDRDDDTGVDTRDEFVRERVTAPPHETYRRDYRLPQWSFMLEHFWGPLIRLNRVQAVELAEAGVVDPAEAGDLLAALAAIDEAAADGIPAATREEHEDPYLYLEHELVARLGERVGGTIHSGRSRNDLLGAAVRLAMRDGVLDILEATLALREAVLGWAEETTDVVLPAFTHSQPAQPIVLAHYLLGFDHLLARDGTRLRRAFEATNRSPLGAAAIGGTRFPLDRDRLATLAGFDGVEYNTYDAIASVDFVPQTTTAVALLLTNVSRLSRDLIEWSMFEFQFVELADSLATVSTIMPQKKNPSVLEKARASAGDAIGAATSALTHLKGVRYGDAGERARYVFVPFLEEREDVCRTLRLCQASVETTTANPDRMLADAAAGFTTMTALADTLVQTEDVSFRVAHEISARVTRRLLDTGRTAEAITYEDIATVAADRLETPLRADPSTIRSAVSPTDAVRQNDVVGGTAPGRISADLERQREQLAEQRAVVEAINERLAERSNRLDDRCADLREDRSGAS